MDQQVKTPRKRVANFTADEKVLLAQLIKKQPIIESKLTDGKSIAKKQGAWELITRECNSNANVNKRETITLKRAWDNLKSMTRKTRATERGNLIRTGGGPQQPPPSPQNGAIITMVEDAAPVMISEITNYFDSDGTILSAIDDVQEVEEKTHIIEPNFYIQDHCPPKSPLVEIVETNPTKDSEIKKCLVNNQHQGRRPADYIRREAVLRIKFLESKNKIETQILKTQLEVQQIQKRAALLEEERNKLLLEKARIELDKLKKSN